MKSLSKWAKENDMSYNAAYRMFKYGQIPNSEQIASGGIVIKDAPQETAFGGVLDSVPLEGSLFGEKLTTKGASRHNRGAFDNIYNRFSNIDKGFLPAYSSSKSTGSSCISPQEAIILCQKAYFNFSIVRNVIDVLTEFSCNDLHFRGGSKKTRDFFTALLSKNNIKGLQDKFFREYYRSGNVFIYRFDSSIKESDINKLMQVFGDEATAATLKLPVRYIILNPADIQIDTTSNFTDGKYLKMLNSYEVSQLKNPKTEEDKAVFDNLPSETKKLIKDGSATVNIPLDTSKARAVFYKKQDYEPYAVPMIFPVLDDLEWKSELKKMDQHIARTIQQAILLVTFGYESKDGKYVYNQNIAKAYQSIFENESVGRVLIGDFSTKAQFIIPQVADILDPKKYEVVNEDIRAGLNDILFGGSSEKFANQSIKMQVFVERLQAGRDAFIYDFLLPEIKRISKELGFKNYPEPFFEELNLKDEILLNRIYAQLAQLGYLTPEETFHVMETGVLPDSETSLENQKRFKEYKDSGLYQPLIGGKPLENGRPAGTSSPQTIKNVSPVGTSKAEQNFSAQKVLNNLILAEKVRENIEKSLKDKHKVKKLNAAQSNIIKDLVSLIVCNEKSENWMNKYSEYLSNPTDKNEANVSAVLEISAKHGVEPFLGGILYNSLT